MNIFEFLGLSADHRNNEKKTTQLVKHFDEVVEKNKKGKNFGVQIKKDGVCSIVVVHHGFLSIFSRTAKEFTNTEILRDTLSKMELRNGVYFGEMTCDIKDVSLEMLSGVVNPNRVQPLSKEQVFITNNLTMNFFDLISIESYIEGASQTPYRTRYDHLVERVESSHYKSANVKVIPLVGFGEKGFDKLNIVIREIDFYLKTAVSMGEEGIIIADLDADWQAGHKGWRKMKKVRGVDYDLKCIGYEEGTGKYAGKVANLIFQWKGGKTVKCMLGKGWTHQMAEDMFKVIKHLENNELPSSSYLRNDNPIGKIFQVYALEESSKGKLRLPKVGEQRHDKGEADVN